MPFPGNQHNQHNNQGQRYVRKDQNTNMPGGMPFAPQAQPSGAFPHQNQPGAPMGGANTGAFAPPQQQPAPGMGVGGMPMPATQQPTPAPPTFSLDRPAGGPPRPRYAQFQAKNTQYGETIDLSFNLGCKTFVPTGGAQEPASEYPAAPGAGTFNVGAPQFKPASQSGPFKPANRPPQQTAPVQPPAPEAAPPKPKKEAAVLALERLAGQEEGDSPAGDAAPSAPLVETFKQIKAAKKVTSELLRCFVSAVGGLTNPLPADLVQMSASRRVLARGDEGEFKALPESNNQRPKRDYNKRPQGYSDGRGGFEKGRRPGDGDRGGYNKNSRYAQQEYEHRDPGWRQAQDEMRAKLQAAGERSILDARGAKDEAQKIRLCLNQIAPNNFEKKTGELRSMLIGDALLLAEPGFD